MTHEMHSINDIYCDMLSTYTLKSGKRLYSGENCCQCGGGDVHDPNDDYTNTIETTF